MNTTSKVILAVAIALNVTALAVVSGMALHRHSRPQADTLRLGAIVVTPADAEAGTVNLGAVLVTPSDADWRYAEVRGVQRPLATNIVLAPITVQPTNEQLAEVAAVKMTSNAPAAQATIVEDAASASLVKALEAVFPGQYLDTNATLRVFNALVFERAGG